MGHEWLSRVRQTLEDAGFAVEAGYPGRRAAVLSAPAVALNLSGLDLGEGRATITAAVLAPRRTGLAAGQEMAEKAVRALSALGGKWSYEGHRFDSHLDGYCVEVRGLVTVAPEPGFRVRINGAEAAYVTDLLARQQQERDFYRPHGAADPSSVTPGMGGWRIRMTQVLPAEVPEPERTADGFTLEVVRGGETVRYTGCCWDQYSGQQTALGLRVIRTGLALSREVSSDE